MSFHKASCSFTRFRQIGDVSSHMGENANILKRFAFRDIDDLPEERAFGWVCLDNWRDSEWRTAPPEKGHYLCFSFRLDTRRIPAGIIIKHFGIAMDKEMERNREQGKAFINRERIQELREQVVLRLRSRFLPSPSIYNVVWDTTAGTLWLASTQGNILNLFEEYFCLSFEFPMHRVDPYDLAASLIGGDRAHVLDRLEGTTFCAGAVTDGSAMLAESTNLILGQDFLTWLWFQSDTAPCSLVDAAGMPFGVSLEQRVVVQGGSGEAMETASVAGALSPLREARYGLATGKKVARAFIRLEQDGLNWSFNCKGADFGFNSFKAPPVDVEGDEPDAKLLEKLYLLEKGVGLFDAAYAAFLQVRLSAQWGEETQKVAAWARG